MYLSPAFKKQDRNFKKNFFLSSAFLFFSHHLSLMDTKRHISDPEQDPIESSHGTSVT